MDTSVGQSTLQPEGYRGSPTVANMLQPGISVVRRAPLAVARQV